MANGITMINMGSILKATATAMLPLAHPSLQGTADVNSVASA